ncbi:MAG: NUDIX hydrolase [Candidatus Iainarchaeum archaeon]|uniref:NUDIX hydrolase n=1 Tax=Candidatus Iainarchaeum sp. TaxID=3101447 RepID=A0A7T9I236_9ARCH|nr:MAG: NUDIX hydrolase [Candidatus Diapherotrites archaeon]
MTRAWKTTATGLIYENKWARLRHDQVVAPDGSNTTYTFIEKPDCVAIIARNRDGGIYLIREYRYPVQQTLWQLPAGGFEKGLTFQENAQKELKEETGITAQKWEKLGHIFIHPGSESTCMHVFLAQELDEKNVGTHGQETNEAIEHIEKISPQKLDQLIRDNAIVCGWTLAALNLFLHRFPPKKN